MEPRISCRLEAAVAGSLWKVKVTYAAFPGSLHAGFADFVSPFFGTAFGQKPWPDRDGSEPPHPHDGGG